jgi:hypothetical protein
MSTCYLYEIIKQLNKQNLLLKAMRSYNRKYDVFLLTICHSTAVRNAKAHVAVPFFLVYSLYVFSGGQMA